MRPPVAMQSTWAKRYIKTLALALLLIVVTAFLGWLTLRLGGCRGGMGWSALNCSRIPNAVGSLAFNAMIAPFALAWHLRWLWIPLLALPLIVEWRARRV